jgi:hypothetical protein
MINSAFARRYFPGENPVGKQINFKGAPSSSAMEIVGVVDEVKEGQLDFAPRAAFYVPFNQQPFPFFSIVVRATQDSRSLLPEMSKVIHEIDPSIASFNGESMVERLHDSPAAYLHRSSAWLASGFAGLALLLGVIGLYGVIAYSVSQRTREIGIRMALGAHRHDVFALIMRQGALQTALAVGAGLLLSLAAGRVLAKILYDVSPSDPLALITATLMLASAALLACFFPANRATRVNPITALRTE